MLLKTIIKYKGERMTQKKDKYVIKTISMLERHVNWINKKTINLSRYVRNQIETDMDNEDEV